MAYKSAKLLYVLFIFYVIWYQRAIAIIDGAPLMLGVGMFVMLFIYKLFKKKKLKLILTTPLKYWLAFVAFILISGYFVALDRGLLISSVITYAETLLMMIFIIDVSKIDKSNSFFLKSYVLLTVVYAITLIFFGTEVNGQAVISTESNPNVDGLILVFGVSCLLMMINVKNKLEIIITFLLVVFFSYGIILTSSRKSLMAVVLLIAMWVIFVYGDYLKALSIGKKIILLLTFIVAIVITMYVFLPFFFNSMMYYRLMNSYGYQGDIDRKIMYELAWQFFKEKPFIGIGFNQFIVYFGKYSHSTYAEALACTGSIGTTLYFIPYLIIIYDLILVMLNSESIQSVIKAKQYLILMLVLLSLGVGVIHFYGISENLMLALMISFYYNEKIKLIDLGRTHLLRRHI